MNKRNDFISIGAVHLDYILILKNNYFKNRTNPILHKENLGGVAYNIAQKLSFLDQYSSLYSLNCELIQKKIIKQNKIKFINLNKSIFKRYYTSVIDKNGKMIFGLANMEDYEKKIFFKKLINLKNKNIILDLNLSSEFIQNTINENFKNNYICVCGTSAYKVNKVKKLLNKIDTIIINKQEGFAISKKNSIKDSMSYLIKKNKKLNIIITNGKNAVNAYLDKKNYIIYPPKTKIKNENGAGDALSAIFNYFYCNSFKKLDSLIKGICAGSLQASGFKYNNKEKYLQKINKLSRSIKYKKSYHNE